MTTADGTSTCCWCLSPGLLLPWATLGLLLARTPSSSLPLPPLPLPLPLPLLQLPPLPLPPLRLAPLPSAPLPPLPVSPLPPLPSLPPVTLPGLGSAVAARSFLVPASGPLAASAVMTAGGCNCWCLSGCCCCCCCLNGKLLSLAATATWSVVPRGAAAALPGCMPSRAAQSAGAAAPPAPIWSFWRFAAGAQQPCTSPAAAAAAAADAILAAAAAASGLCDC